ncbi:MAG: hypothetical protein ACLFSB_06520, partial [Chitinispirillaceae bacterium]
GERYARFLWDSRQEPWENPCIPGISDSNATFWGPDILKQYYSPEGDPLGTWALNWVPGTGSPSAVVAQDFDLMGLLYRNLEIKWDGTEGGRYITSVPKYFHGWFRLLGMLVLTGNYQRPSEIKPTANMKVYLDIDKTFAFERDTITYTIDYRNYGSLDAQSVTITDTLHPDFVYVSSTGGGVFDAASNVVTWNIGTVPGFQTETGVEPTTGQVSLKVLVGTANESQYRNRVSITCANGTGWTSNDFPNNISSVMERNHLDIAKRALVVDKRASNTHVNPGSEIEFTIDFENTSEAGWINGGRPGVHFAYSHEPLPSGTAEMTSMRARLFHDADEAYIDYGNYRISYFLFDAGLKCYAGDDGCSNGWQVQPTIVEGVDENFVTILHENITPGEDENGKWNQRIILQFSEPTNPERTINLITTNYHVNWYRGIEGMIHRGGTETLRMVWNVNTSTWTDAIWSDDWSWDPDAEDTDDGKYWPVTNDWTDPDNPDVPVTTWNPKECDTASHTVDNVLVEEWDGYTWRRVAGNGPLPGRDVSNLVIRDTIPAGFSFSRFTGDAPFDVEPSVDGNVISWSIPKLQINRKGSISYVATASGACPMQDNTIMTRAWASADRESAISDSMAVTVTCDSVPPPPPPPTTIYKRSDRPVYQEGDTVTYNITYKQTHGSIVTDASDINEWIDQSGNGTFSMSDDTIAFDKPAITMVHSYSYGVNGTFGGTINPPYYSEFSLVARSSESDFVEIRFFKDYGDMRVQFYNNGTQVGGDQSFTYTNFSSTPPTFDFKIKLAGDTVSLWAGDTTGPSPNVTQTGIMVQPGYAGVKSVSNDNGQAQLWSWNSHFDAAFDVVIHDPLPTDLTFTSAGGSIVTGPLAGREISAEYNNGDITWPIVSGQEILEADDSLALWVRGTLNRCTGDTILNTAYANIRGYPVDYIGARSRISCATEDDGRPWHVDIILDTTSFNRTSDENIDTLVLGPNQRTYTLYAIIRDRHGNFLRFANAAAWSSTDESVASVSGTSGGAGVGIISNVGSGSALIRVNEPEIQGDSIVVTITNAPNWPAIQAAVMLDSDGNIWPDMVSLSLLSDFEEGQRLDSVTMDYRGNHYQIPADSVTRLGLVLQVPFTTLSGIDGRPAGDVTIHMSNGESSHHNTRPFVDGVGPALSAASVMENNEDQPDTLILTFTEPVLTSSLHGTQLLLIKQNTTDTTELTIQGVVDSLNDRLMMVSVTSASQRPAAGDALRLMPEGQDGTISDLNSNLPHDLNPPVELTLRRGPAAISSAAYFDDDADGFVDFVRVRFRRDVELSEFQSISVVWNIESGAVEQTIPPDQLHQVDDSTLQIPASGAAVSPETIMTDPDMDISITYVSFSEAPIRSAVADSAAPVILSAQIFPGTVISSVRQSDTLKVVLSEPISLTHGAQPFTFETQEGHRYNLTMNLKNLFGTTYIFMLENNDDGNAKPYAEGDSLWINPQAQITDGRGAVQDNPNNRRVELDVNWPPSVWEIKAGPNHFSPKSNGENITIKVRPTTPVEFDDIEIECIIYDALGNRLDKQILQMQGYAFFGTWDGCNENDRYVGDGVYTAFIIIREEKGETIKKLPIGVKN